jgi:hypothetical protein
MNENTLIDDQEIKPKPKGFPKWLKAIETILFGMAGIGLIFKFMHWVGADFLMLISLGGLAAIYFALYFNIDRTRYAKKYQKRIMRLGGVVLAITLIGILFRLFFWSKSELSLMASYPTLILGYIVIHWRIKEYISAKDAKRMGSRFLLIGFIGFCMLHLISVRTQASLNYNNRASDELLDAFEAHYEDPYDVDKRVRYRELIEQHWDSIMRVDYGEEYLPHEE